MDTEVTEGRSKRKKLDRHGRGAAFEKLKKLKGSKHKYEVSEMENVYEVVDERVYEKEVMKRHDDDWIVNDDGGGYIEDGRDIFDDDLDSESIKAASKQKSAQKSKRKAVSGNAGKGSLQFMLSNMPNKKKEEVKIEEDDLLSELIQEIDTVPGTRNKTDLRSPSTTKSSNNSSFSEKEAAKSYMKTFSMPKPKLITPSKKVKINTPERPKMQIFKPENILKEVKQNIVITEEKEIEGVAEESEMQSKEENVINEQRLSQKENESILETSNAFAETTDFFDDDDFDMTQIEDVDVNSKVKEEITEEQLLSGWNTMQTGDCNDEIGPTIDINTTDLPIITNESNQQVFRFFWWDAFEDRRSQPGVVFLFGKTYYESVKSYVSCCVAVRNIERKIFLLPRTNFKNDETKPVTLLDVYHEFNNNVANQMQLEAFKSRKVTKNYAFDPSVPAESEYLEVRYSAKAPPVNSENCTGNTYSRIFGVNSSSLEIFLLERKIKGPCWLDVVKPEAVTNPLTLCKLEVSCLRASNISVTKFTKPLPPPPLVVAAINMRTVVSSDNKLGLKNEIVMISVLVQPKYCVDKQEPNPPFKQHFCVFAKPSDCVLPFNIHDALHQYKATKVQKMDSEKGLLNYFVNQFANIDPDLIVGHDLYGYEIDLLCNRLRQHQIHLFSKLSRIKRNEMPLKGRFEKEVFCGRLVCDIKVSAKELIKSRSFDLDTLCQTVLKVSEGQRVSFEPEEIPKMYQTSADLLKLITLTMQDTAYILKIMYELNIIPLALQITNIAGNIMSRTLLGGRSERNEFLLLHAFSEKDYIVPDKEYAGKNKNDQQEDTTSSKKRKKPTYAGGLVLDPKVGFYDKFILVMDFNSLYPSIIQEYNVCFTTFIFGSNVNLVIPDKTVQPGILPTEIRKLVESRREVKKLMKNVDSSGDLYMQYHIRQMALKLTANSMYGCLGFSNSRFFAKELAAFVTERGREILTNTKDLVEKLTYEVIYGDTDSIMINTNCTDFDEVMKIGNKIKIDVNKLYRQVELDIDGVFKYLLLLKKKKYAAVTLTKTKSGELKEVQEHKGLDIVRRDWSPLSSEAGKVILNHILSNQVLEERIENIQIHLNKLQEDLKSNSVPLPLLTITKQLTKNPKEYSQSNILPHVQVALRYNSKGGKQLRSGDTVAYIICDDGTNAPATQRAYHVEELKNSTSLKIDVNYYLSQQIHPVISRLCEPVEGIDAYQIAMWLGLDPNSYKKQQKQTENVDDEFDKAVRFANCEPFTFTCHFCKTENSIKSFIMNGIPFLEKCGGNNCNVRPLEYLSNIQNQLVASARTYIDKYYSFEMICEDQACGHETSFIPIRFSRKNPICTSCEKGVMHLKYSAKDLHMQLTYFQNLFDFNKYGKKSNADSLSKMGYNSLKETTDGVLKHSSFNVINLKEMFTSLMPNTPGCEDGKIGEPEVILDNPEQEEEEEDI